MEEEVGRFIFHFPFDIFHLPFKADSYFFAIFAPLREMAVHAKAQRRKVIQSAVAAALCRRTPYVAPYIARLIATLVIVFSSAFVVTPQQRINKQELAAQVRSEFLHAW